MDISLNTSVANQTINGVANNAGRQVDNDARRQRIEPSSGQEQSQQAQSQQVQRDQRLDANEDTLALIEEQYQAAQAQNVIPSQSGQNSTLLEPSNQNQNFSSNSSTSNNTLYDAPTEQNQGAISAYQGVNNIAQRASIEQQFGVDLYA